MTNSTQDLHATDCSAQRKTTQISSKYANKYTQNMGLATAGAKNERKNTRRLWCASTFQQHDWSTNPVRDIPCLHQSFPKPFKASGNLLKAFHTSQRLLKPPKPSKASIGPKPYKVSQRLPKPLKASQRLPIPPKASQSLAEPQGARTNGKWTEKHETFVTCVYF